MAEKISLRYGNEQIWAWLPAGTLVEEVKPNALPAVTSLRQEIISGLRRPIGSEALRVLAQKAHRAVVVISDQTRPLPSDRILPILCNELIEAGLKMDSLMIVIGVGNHRPVKEAEKQKLLGPLYGQIKCLHSRETGYAELGMTKRGTPVEVAIPVAEADLVVALGNIEIHQLAGFSGGAKAVAAGVASRRALEHNHRLAQLQENNPGPWWRKAVRQDMEEFARIAKLGFIINVVLDESRQVVRLVAGDPVSAHRAGCLTAHALYAVEVKNAADLVVISPGGEPKDCTVYQAQKSIKNALPAVAKGGIIIVAAKCREGFGDPVFEQWMDQAAVPGDLERRASREFVLGGHKGALIAQAVKKARIFWVSDLEPAQVRKLFFEPYNTLQAAIDSALEIKGERPRILVMPWAGLTVPVPGRRR